MMRMKRAALSCAAILTLAVWAIASISSAQPKTDAAKPAGDAAKPAEPAAPPANPDAILGDWTIAIEGLPGGPKLGDVHAEKAGDKITGNLKTPLGEVKVDEITVSGPNHVLTFFIDAMGNSMDVQASVKVEGEKFKGDMVVGGGMMSAALQGAKKGSKAEAELKTWVEEKVKEIVGVPTLPVEKAKDFIGVWMFQGDSPMGGPMEIQFELKDIEGKCSGELAMPPPLGTQTINKMDVNEDGALTMNYQLSFAGQDMNMVIEMERQGAMIGGLIDVGDGLFQIPLEGVKKGRGLSKVNISGKNILVEFGRPSTSGSGYKQLSTVKEGTVWRMGKDDVSTLKTDGELKFGEKTLKPGHYGIFAKKTGSGWNLLFNEQNSGHPMSRDTKKDLFEVPLTAGKADAEVADLTLKLSSKEGKGVFQLAWGKETGETTFEVVLPPPPPAPAGGTTGGAAK